MKALLLTIAIITLTITNAKSDKITKDQKCEGQTAVSVADNFRPISIRTYYLETVRTTNNTTLTYSDFIKAVKACDIENIITNDNYKVVIINDTVKTFKNFPTLYVHSTTDEANELARIAKLNKSRK